MAIPDIPDGDFYMDVWMTEPEGPVNLSRKARKSHKEAELAAKEAAKEAAKTPEQKFNERLDRALGLWMNYKSEHKTNRLEKFKVRINQEPSRMDFTYWLTVWKKIGRFSKVKIINFAAETVLLPGHHDHNYYVNYLNSVLLDDLVEFVYILEQKYNLHVQTRFEDSRDFLEKFKVLDELDKELR